MNVGGRTDHVGLVVGFRMPGASRRRVAWRPVILILAVVLATALLLGAGGLFTGSAQAAVSKAGVDLFSRWAGSGHPSADSSLAVKKPKLFSPGFSHEKGLAIQAAGTGSVSGLVRNSSGNPLAHVEVDVYTVDGDWLGFVWTSASGTYQMGGLPNVTVYVATDCRDSGLNYVDEWYDNVTFGDHQDGEGATPLDLKSQPQRTHIDFQLNPGHSISGTVKNTGGSGVAECEIVVMSIDGSFFDTGTADWNGSYSVSGLPNGQYYVGTSNFSGYVDEWYDNVVLAGNYEAVEAKPVDIRTADATKINFVLAPGKSISGHIRNAGGSPLEFTEVDAVNAAGDSVGAGMVEPGSNGAYEIGGLPPGQYRVVTLNMGAYIDEWYDNVPVAADPKGTGATLIDVRTANATGKDFVLALGRTITGTVRNASGQPLEGVEVDANDLTAEFVNAGWTDRNGTFEIEGLYPGQYKLNTFNDQGYVDEWNDNTILPGHLEGKGVTPVDVSSANATGIEFALDPGFSISGKVVEAGTKAALQDPMVVFVVDGDGNLYAGSAIGDSEMSDPTTYTTWALPAGTYYARAEDYFQTAPYAGEWYKDLPIPQYTLADATPITVTSANVTGIDFALTKLTRYQQSDGHIAYSPSAAWPTVNSMAASGATYVRSSTAGSSATIYFRGTRLDWIAVLTANVGKADVFVDDVAKGTVDLSDFDWWYPRAKVWSTGDVADGDHKVTIRYSSANAAGKSVNIDAVDVQGVLTYGPPSISSLSPATGNMDGGTKVIINGYGFSGVTSVRFGDSPATFTVNSSSKITATAPAHARGTVQVKVTTPVGSTQNSAADDFVYAYAPLVPVEQTNGRLIYSPSASWITVNSSPASGGSYTRASASGAYVVIPFNGTRLDWIATKASMMGKADVYLDGVKKATVNLAATNASFRNVVWTSGTLTPGYHFVKIVRNTTSAPGKCINLDRVDVVGSVILGTWREQDDSHIVYAPSGAWTTFTKAASSAGTHAGSNANLPVAARVTIHFDGMRLDWIAATGPGMGMANVYLDGVRKGTIDLHRPAIAAYRQMVWSSGFLAPGPHVVTIVRNGSSPAGKYIDVDAVRVFGVLK